MGGSIDETGYMRTNWSSWTGQSENRLIGQNKFHLWERWRFAQSACCQTCRVQFWTSKEVMLKWSCVKGTILNWSDLKWSYMAQPVVPVPDCDSTAALAVTPSQFKYWKSLWRSRQTLQSSAKRQTWYKKLRPPRPSHPLAAWFQPRSRSSDYYWWNKIVLALCRYYLTWFVFFITQRIKKKVVD